MTCPRCGAHAVTGARFCTRCGAPLVPAVPANPSAPGVAQARILASAAAPILPHLHGPAERSLHYLALGAVGLVMFGLSAIMLGVLSVEAHTLPALIVGMFMAVLPVPIYALLIVSLDRHQREPIWMLFGAFFWGAVVAVTFAFFLNTAIAKFFATHLGREWAGALTPSIVAPVVEETSKGIALLLIYFMFRARLNDVVDGIVFGALVGLGFAMTENVLYFSRIFNSGGLVGVGVLFYVRSILNGFGHSLYTGATGAGVGLAEETSNPVVRWVAPVAGYGVAIFLHFLWNTVNGIVGHLVAAPPLVEFFVVLPFIAALLTLPGIITLLVITFFAWRRESRVIASELQDEVQRGVVRPGEYALLCHDRGRARQIWSTLFHYGPLAWYAVRQLYNLEIALAFRKQHSARGERLPAYEQDLSEDALRAHILAARARLNAMGVPAE